MEGVDHEDRAPELASSAEQPFPMSMSPLHADARPSRIDRPSPWRRWLLGGSALVILGVVGWRSVEAGSAEQTAVPVTSAAEMVVIPQDARTEVNIAARIEAGRMRPVLAPFDGVIQRMDIQYGDRVLAGDNLASLDVGLIRAEARTARAAYMKAQMLVKELENWDNGSDMLRARRTLDAEAARLATLDREAEELRALLASGIIARSEYQTVEQQRETQRLAISAARDDLVATANKASTEHRELAHLELENAREKFDAIEAQMARARVTAPASGVLVRPPRPASGEAFVAEVGSKVAADTAMFAIADTTELVAAGYVDEADVVGLRIGQKMTVASDAIPGLEFEGQVISISAEARTEGGIGQRPSYAVRASFVINQGTTANAVRLGMSARLKIVVEENKAALILPPQAIGTDSNGTYALVRRFGNAQYEKTTVQIERSLPQGLLVTSGINEGDTIRLSINDMEQK